MFLCSTSWMACSSERPGTRVINHGGAHLLVLNGQPYFIQGVGGQTYLDRLAAAGGNSIRTWGADHLDEILDEAHRHGLTVCAGLWMGHERHGFDYRDRSAVQQQLKESLETVRRHKDHPAVLMWGIGNEMEGDGSDSGNLAGRRRDRPGDQAHRSRPPHHDGDR